MNTARSLRVKSRAIEAAIRHLKICIEIEVAATLALNQFQTRYIRAMINRDPLLRDEETRLIAAKTKAWNDRFAAWRAANPPSLEDVLWIVAKSGFTREVAPLMNLSKATRECKNLQRVMREVRNWPRWGGRQTQLHYYCDKGMSSSVVRMLEMKSIDVEAREGGGEDGWTCLHTAAYHGHLDTCHLLIDKGAQVEAKDSGGYTPLHYAAYHGHVEIVRLLCDRGADVEARTYDNANWRGWRPLHFSVSTGHISVVKELIESRNAEINARDNDGRSALRMARDQNKPDIADYLVSHSGIE
jgi:hypothetical protein